MTSKYPRLTQAELAKLRTLDLNNVPGLVSDKEVLDKRYGASGTQSREEFDAKAKAWYYGELLRDRRKALGLTQKDLAEMIGRERSYINRIEKGETDMQLSSFLRIAAALGIMLRLDVALE